MDKIILKEMEFFARHGALPEERALGQKFILDVELRLDLRPAGLSDDLTLTIDYAQVFEAVRSIVCDGRPRRLIEALAEAVAAELLERFPANRVKVRVKKPQAPVPGRFAWLGVEITREKPALKTPAPAKNNI